MKSSLNGMLHFDGMSCFLLVSGLIGHPKTHFPPMYRLYLLLKSCGTPPTDNKLRIVQGEKVLDPATAVQYLAQLKQASVNIVDAFNKQVTKAFDNWNQARFEKLLAQWLQSFIWLVLQSKTLFNVPYVLYTTIYGCKAHCTIPSAFFFHP
jgi:hypothetical protein